MPVKKMRQLGDPVLRTQCAEVPDPDAPEIASLAEDLAHTLADWSRRTGYGRGIAAPQIGRSLRVIYLNVDRPRVLINPRITRRSPAAWEPWEACLSFSLEFFCRVRRSTWINVSYQTPDGARYDQHAEGWLAHVLQHEIDHLDGVLAVDRITSASTLCMRSEFEHRYRRDSPYGQ